MLCVLQGSLKLLENVYVSSWKLIIMCCFKGKKKEKIIRKLNITRMEEKNVTQMQEINAVRVTIF